MSNQFLQRFIKNKNDFHQKFAKIQDFKVDYPYNYQLEKKTLLNLSIILRIHHIYYRISYTKNHGFENLVVFFEWSTLKSSVFANFWWKSFLFFINLFRIRFDINTVASTMLKNGPASIFLSNCNFLTHFLWFLHITGISQSSFVLLHSTSFSTIVRRLGNDR